MPKYIVRSYKDIEEIPENPGIYIVWSLRSKFDGRPQYVGKTKRDVVSRMSEHEDRLDKAIPTFFPLPCTIEFRKVNRIKDLDLEEKRLIHELKPRGNKHHNR